MEYFLLRYLIPCTGWAMEKSGLQKTHILLRYIIHTHNRQTPG